MSASTADKTHIDAMGLYVDSIDCKPQHFDWSENPRENFGDEGHGTPWSFTEYRDPEEGDEATCDECSEDIVFGEGEWHHKKADCINCGTPIEYGDQGWAHAAEAPEDSGCWSGEEGPEPDDTHDAEPDSEYAQDSDYVTGPMMNYWYPVEIRDAESAARKLAHLPLCVVEVDGETGLALTGGGMDFSWEICEAFIAVGSYPPFHFVSSLPKMAVRPAVGHELVVTAGRKVCQIVAERAQSAEARLDDTARWMKDREWETNNLQGGIP